MTRISNATGSKAVVITEDVNGNIRAMYVQVIETLFTYGREVHEQVLQAKSFATAKNAERWASKILGA